MSVSYGQTNFIVNQIYIKNREKPRCGNGNIAQIIAFMESSSIYGPVSHRADSEEWRPAKTADDMNKLTHKTYIKKIVRMLSIFKAATRLNVVALMQDETVFVLKLAESLNDTTEEWLHI
jgi:hypothetical protein